MHLKIYVKPIIKDECATRLECNLKIKIKDKIIMMKMKNI